MSGPKFEEEESKEELIILLKYRGELRFFAFSYHTDTVYDIKQRFQAKTGLPVQKQVLILDDEELEDH